MLKAPAQVFRKKSAPEDVRWANENREANLIAKGLCIIEGGQLAPTAPTKR